MTLAEAEVSGDPRELYKFFPPYSDPTLDGLPQTMGSLAGAVSHQEAIAAIAPEQTALILAPGPSLADAFRWSYVIAQGLFPAPNSIIAVNRAIRCRALPINAWAFDTLAVLTSNCECVRDPKMAVVTHLETVKELDRKGMLWLGPIDCFEQAAAQWDPPAQWRLLTSLSAIVYAVAKGARLINIIGMDLTGEADFDGWAQAGNRSPSRWELERQLFDSMVHYAALKGIIIQRLSIADGVIQFAT